MKKTHKPDPKQETLEFFHALPPDGLSPEQGRAEGERRKKRMIAHHEAVSPSKVEMAYQAILTVARRGNPFTTDEVWDHLGIPSGKGDKSMGAAILRASRRSVIVQTGRQVKSRQKGCHGRKKDEWIGVW